MPCKVKCTCCMFIGVKNQQSKSYLLTCNTPTCLDTCLPLPPPLPPPPPPRPPHPTTHTLWSGLLGHSGSSGELSCLVTGHISVSSFYSCSSFFPVPLFHLLYYLFYLLSPFLWDFSSSWDKSTAKYESCLSCKWHAYWSLSVPASTTYYQNISNY